MANLIRRPNVKIPSQTTLSRRAFVASTFGLGAVAYFLPADDPISKACSAWRACSARFVEIESDYQRQAPDLSGDYRAARRLEDRLGNALGAARDAADAIIAELDKAGLSGARDGAELFLVHDVEPEGVRRLVVLPADRIRGL
jgi:hypothetical protein